MISEAIKKIRETQPSDRITLYTEDGVHMTSSQIADNLEAIIKDLGDKYVGELNNLPLLAYINSIFTYY